MFGEFPWRQNHLTKLITEIGEMSVIELADFVKALEEKFGVTAAMPMAAGVAAGAAAELQKQKLSLNTK